MSVSVAQKSPVAALYHARHLLREDPRYPQLFQLAATLLTRGRWYDLWHTIIAVHHMYEVLAAEQPRIEALYGRNEYLCWRRILIPAIVLHDIGWAAAGEEKQSNWRKRELRCLHMAIGCELAKAALIEVGYDDDLTPDILDLVAHHDDQYLGIEPATDIAKTHRDVDACFIFTYPSFWKDYETAHTEKSPLAYLAEKVDKHAKRYTNSAQAIVDQEVLARRKEATTAGSLTPRRRYLLLRQQADELNQHYQQVLPQTFQNILSCYR